MTCENCFNHAKNQKCQKFCDTREIIVISDKKSTQWTFKNPAKKCVCHIQIDGCIIENQEVRKCDHLFLVCDEKSAFLIELKGKKLEDALEQILSTLQQLKNNLTGFNIYARVALTRAPKILSPKAEKIEKQLGKLLGHSPLGREKLRYQASAPTEEI
jgi:hypothetical protein